MIEFTIALLGLGCGAIAAAPVVQQARRSAVSVRVARPGGRHRSLRWARGHQALGPIGRVARGLLGRRGVRRADLRLEAELPIAMDLLIVAVGAGAPPQRAVEIAAIWAPPTVRVPLRQVLNMTGLGGSFTDALDDMARAAPVLAPIADVLVASARLGAPAGVALARLGDDARAQLRRRAETRARKLPVKLLFPLVFLVLPAFGLLTVAPALISALHHL